MRISQLHLYTNTLAAERKFYADVLGFSIIEEDTQHISFSVGWTTLTFHHSDTPHRYHYCFLIPCNQLIEAFNWMEKRVEIVEIETGVKTVHFDTWNADSFYFYDGSGNIAEFIVRHDLGNESNTVFDISSVLCVNEIGIPTKNIEKINTTLTQNVATPFWKGDLARFGTNGNEEGLFLLPNYEQKDIWFPTTLNIQPERLEVVIENEGKSYRIGCKDEELFFL